MKQYVVDAFTKEIFKGNPAAVCVLDEWLPDNLLQDITKENNLSETAFTLKNKESYQLRWFTPGGEIDLCGHATLATAFVLANFYEPEKETFVFETISGQLIVNKKETMYEMDFPAYQLEKVSVTNELIDALGFRPEEVYQARDLVCVVKDKEFVRDYQPDLSKIVELEGLLLHITAQGREYDCVSRSFAPKLNVAEDPVCGSGHCHIAPLWAEKLKKNHLVAFQSSKRTGILHCEVLADRVVLKGEAALYSTCELNI
ncbi:PhzF family phenazine biosynthesis protein [Enterococcus hulanensis]|uniref:PhzF family phenazine biosynthesis protein n=1 Tax=Enterococcus hulanensis TaxID=2559929 RepID=UPI001A8DCC6A|nr:PhzF family phenazine biosynthesis protein [Enterococcus hulanensis]MBO0458240.1 PhzF family phenazine biosynthesis protein [Enterococcus hulanensis]